MKLDRGRTKTNSRDDTPTRRMPQPTLRRPLATPCSRTLRARFVERHNEYAIQLRARWSCPSGNPNRAHALRCLPTAAMDGYAGASNEGVGLRELYTELTTPSWPASVVEALRTKQRWAWRSDKTETPVANAAPSLQVGCVPPGVDRTSERQQEHCNPTICITRD